jgi:signal transduction histidine kinase
MEYKIGFQSNAFQSTALSVENKTAEKEKQLIISNQKKKQNRNIAFGLGGGLIGVSLIGFLLFKNTKRKQLIAEQEREIEIQKKEKILKDQELNTIDAMIEGQEKERQRLASDLHDSVGATLSAARLQFEHLCKYKGSGTLKNEDELYTKTGKLLEQVYQEIRSMAHLKNSGVIATKGLLPAIQKLARNASTPGGLQIEVDDFGLSVKIENSLEISIFRVIQELITNIIKHAQATEATISITQHEDSLSIIVEDNGLGFDVKKSIDKDGMGLSSIEKRIEHLEGSMEVDSNLGKGTNILIDIPI